MGISNDNFEDEEQTIETLEDAMANQDREAAEIERNRVLGLEAAARAERIRRQRNPRLRLYDSAMERRNQVVASMRNASNRLPNFNTRVRAILARQRERMQ